MGGRGASSGAKTLDKSQKSSIIKDNNNRTAATDVHYIGKINVEMYKCVSKDIVSDEVIITENQIAHIKERHPNAYEHYSDHFSEIVAKPDYILEANKPNSALILKQFPSENGYTKTVLRLHTSLDNPEYKNSIITFVEINEREWNRLIKNKKVLYKSE